MDLRLEGAAGSGAAGQRGRLGKWTLSGTREGNIQIFSLLSLIFVILYYTKILYNSLLLNRRTNFVFVKTLLHKNIAKQQ